MIHFTMTQISYQQSRESLLEKACEFVFPKAVFPLYLS